MKRISIPEIRQHPWFRENLPLYIASPSTDALSKTEKVTIIHFDHLIIFLYHLIRLQRILCP